jgi:surfactin synthase thioesterase subunit
VTEHTALDELWFRRFFSAPDAECRLFCFPHAGGSASFYHPLARALAPSTDVLAVQYPGRQDRRAEPNFTGIDEVADQIADLLAPAPDRPFAFFGHSMGAIVSYEVTRRLEQRGLAGPVALFVSGRRAPAVHRIEEVHKGSDDDLLRALRDLSGTDPRILGDEEMLRMILPAVRSDYRAIECYRHAPGAPVTCPIIAIGGEEDPRASVEEMRMWAEHTAGAFDLHIFPGGHFYLVNEQRKVLAVVADRLAALSRRTGV